MSRNKLAEEFHDHDVTGRRPRVDPRRVDDANDIVLGTSHLDHVSDPAEPIASHAGLETHRHLRAGRGRHVSQNLLHARTRFDRDSN